MVPILILCFDLRAQIARSQFNHCRIKVGVVLYATLYCPKMADDMVQWAYEKPVEDQRSLLKPTLRPFSN